jgi:acyl-CoA synthetase (AMP-forming)/AMP-acid ligase II
VSSPRLIEDVLMDHHNVREALAFTVPSEFGIEEVWALTVPIDNLDEENAASALQSKAA